MINDRNPLSSLDPPELSGAQRVRAVLHCRGLLVGEPAE